MRRLNKLLALALALLLAFTLAACGDSFESAMVRALREMQDVESVHADMALDMSFGVDVLGESTSMDIAMDMGMDTAGDLTSGEFTMTMLGIPITVTYIVEKNGDAYDIYLSTDGGSTWESQTGLTEEQLTSGGNYSVGTDAGAMVSFYLEFASNFSEAVDETLDGVDCAAMTGCSPARSSRRRWPCPEAPALPRCPRAPRCRTRRYPSGWTRTAACPNASVWT